MPKPRRKQPPMPQPEPDAVTVPEWFVELGPVERWVDPDTEPPAEWWWRGVEATASWMPDGPPTVDRWLYWLAHLRWGEARDRWLARAGLRWEDVEAGRPSLRDRYAHLTIDGPQTWHVPPGWEPGPPPGGWPR